MKKRSVFLLLVLSAVLFVSCDKNGGNFKGLPAEIEYFIKERYSQSKITEVDRENGRLEIDLIHGNRNKEVVFDLNNRWLYTSWDILPSKLPQSIVDVVGATEYADYRIDDADFYETPEGDYYLLELEKGNKEVKIKIDKNGNVIG